MNLAALTMVVFGAISAFACGEWSEPTAPVILEVTVESSKPVYDTEEVVVFHVYVENVSPGSVVVPQDLSRWLLPLTVLPGGEYKNYKCAPPAPECGESLSLHMLVLEPGEKFSVSISRLAFQGTGTYEMGYALHLYRCSQIEGTHNLVAVSNRIKFRIILK